MCNPRRIRVQATRQLTQAWEQEVRRQITVTRTAVGEARIREPLGPSIGAPTLTALMGVLSRSSGWQERDGVFTYALTGGELNYHPDERMLEIVAFAAEEVRATGTASSVVRGQVDDAISAEGVGVYYDDGWRQTTEQTARADAERDAEAALDIVAQQRIHREQAAADRAAGIEVERLAADQAHQVIDRLAGQRTPDLNSAAAARLTQVGVQGRNVFHLALAEAYRDAIVAYAQSRQARGLTMSHRDGVLEIEFEMDV